MKSATFRGRILVIVGILLAAVTLRSAVTVVPPVVPEISRDLPFDSLTIGLLGMLPTLAFVIFGFLTPFVLRWTSLEKLTILAMLVAVVRASCANFCAEHALVFDIYRSCVGRYGCWKRCAATPGQALFSGPSRADNRALGHRTQTGNRASGPVCRAGC
ncbi:MFS transporter [Renibacterium salmoninarum]|uniref:hypothetical protein n=1 Tax=Renibacterium salmoninarum TaxID=1646 RepID=UPI00131403F8|nr:hypothetical protein [Renibacterium salmoninarum]